MTIRLEEPKDYREVENLTREAFWNVYRPGCTEHFVLNQYRTNPDFIPELDFVMENEGKIIGHIMFSKAELLMDETLGQEGNRVVPSWTFGPISIHPDYKRQGYGLKLLQYALEKARELGVGFLCMEGNIEFYRHAGFGLASRMGIHYHAEPKDAEVPYFLAQELIPGWLKSQGISPCVLENTGLYAKHATYSPPKGYFIAEENPEAFEAYEATFPKKEKLRMPGQLGYEETSQPLFNFSTVGLFTRDNKAIVDFYTKTFGFVTEWDGVQPNVEMTLGAMRIILFPRDAFEQMVSQKFHYPEGFNGTVELAFDVPTFADVDKAYQHALCQGGVSILPPTTEPWGQRTCYIADPEGNLIEIGSFIV